MLGLADARQISQRIVFTSPAAQHILPLMDGERSIDDIVYYQAYLRYSNGRAPAGYLARKRQYADAATQVAPEFTDRQVNRGGGQSLAVRDVAVTVGFLDGPGTGNDRPDPVLGSTLHVADAGAPLPALRVDPHAARESLERFVAAATRRQVECEAVDGQPGRQIVERAAALHADAVVLGTHGRSGVERLMLGSVADRVLRRAPCPVMTVPPGAPASPAFSRLLCATDLSPTADRALAAALAVVERSGGRLLVLHALEMPDLPGDIPGCPDYDVEEFWKAYRDRSCRWIEASIPEPLRARCMVETVMAVGKAHHEILRRARDGGCDLIVLGTQGRGAFERLLLGSTAEQVVRRSPCAVLTVRPA